MSEYMLTLPGQSSKKTVITVGDGYWEGIAAALAQLPQTVANGVSRVGVIGVGSPNLTYARSGKCKPTNPATRPQPRCAASANHPPGPLCRRIHTGADHRKQPERVATKFNALKFLLKSLRKSRYSNCKLLV